MTIESNIAQSALDFHGLNSLKAKASQDSEKGDTIRQVAGQFESLFVMMMLKSMRQASFGDPLFDSSQSEFYRDMADQQLASDMSMNGGLGLQEVIMRQLGGLTAGQSGTPEAGRTFSLAGVKVRPALGIQVNHDMLNRIHAAKPEPVESESLTIQPSSQPMTFSSPEEFVDALWPYAESAAADLGVSPEVILSQAALETGWGRHVLSDANGTSFNLFNIKADASWTGDAVSKTVNEYREGKSMQERAQFRAYESYAESFEDYVDFLQTQPRYREALDVVDDADAFIEALHKAGYATDPQYSDKVRRIMYSNTLAQFSLEDSK
jgi:flagellar protein FlgJ